ncbi:MAG: RNA-binding S4 domain-containing protein [Acidobacteria bacterium]|nr:RNA-binding S4 domain-containing protein [Acidobacteriota bacterium]
MTPSVGTSSAVRVDAWLWAVRIYKTRSMATAACRAGHVRMDGKTLKAAQILVEGDTLRVRRDGEELVLEVRALIAKRVGAELAARCYTDHTVRLPPVEQVVVAQRDRGAGRPSKKDRRELERFWGR